MADNDPDRRNFLKVATCALGGGVGLVAAVPVLRFVLDPATKTTVTGPTEPLDLALKKIDDGVFGVCEICEEPIGKKRLEARPETSLCIKCKEDQEREERTMG